ncbi:MAG: hypothetical protein AAF039_10350 [Bacteroidota bacterium]
MKKKVFNFVWIALVTLSTIAQETRKIDPQVLVGEWKLDMSPQNTSDNNFALMQITSVANKKLKGTFYRKGVALKNGQISTQMGTIHGALTSGDNSGSYNTSFYYDNGKLFGTTHAIERGFLAVWVAEKVD